MASFFFALSAAASEIDTERTEKEKDIKSKGEISPLNERERERGAEGSDEAMRVWFWCIMSSFGRFYVRLRLRVEVRGREFVYISSCSKDRNEEIGKNKKKKQREQECLVWYVISVFK